MELRNRLSASTQCRMYSTEILYCEGRSAGLSRWRTCLASCHNVSDRHVKSSGREIFEALSSDIGNSFSSSTSPKMAPGRLIPSESFGNGMDISGALIDDGKSADESDLDSPSDVLENATVAQNVSRAGLDGASKKSEVISEGGDGENDASDDDDAEFIAARQAASNRKTSKQNKSTKKSRGFQSLGLDGRLLKAITRKGFAVPTPIQRKTLPILIDGQDVVGMARTG